MFLVAQEIAETMICKEHKIVYWISSFTNIITHLFMNVSLEMAALHVSYKYNNCIL